MGTDKAYPPFTQLCTNKKVAELVIGNDMKREQVNNCIEFMVGCIKMCGLGGDGAILVSYEGDTIIFYNQTYVLRQHLPINRADLN